MQDHITGREEGMKFIEPKAYMIAETDLVEDGMCDYLEGVGAHQHASDCATHNAPAMEPGICDCEIDLWKTDAPSPAEALVEVAGRACYRSFRPGLNPNVSKVREGNDTYIANILAVRHGSVLEHASVTFAFVGVSRVFTHELVRHRPGAAYSQESLRYVRLEELVCWYPLAFGEAVIGDLYDALKAQGKINEDFSPPKEQWVRHRVGRLQVIWRDVFEMAESMQVEMSELLCLDKLDGSFGVKKRLTSAMRRLAPIGLGTTIVATNNHRGWRHQIAMRTHPAAEEEIRIVFADIARQLANRFPNLYGDVTFIMAEDGVANHVTFDAGRV